MNAPIKKYTLPELKLGMEVKLSELRNITDTHMILTDTKIIDNNDLIGKLVFFGDNQEDYVKWFKQKKPMKPIYFNSEELEDGVVYDE